MRTTLRWATLFAALSLAAMSSASIIVYTATLDGPSESPPNGSPGTGWSIVTLDTTAITMRVQIQFQDLIGTTTAAHIHAPTAVAFTGTAAPATQVPSFSGFPLGVTAGSYDMTFDMTQASSWNGSFITNNGGTPTAAFNAFHTYMDQGRSYVNVHSTFAGGGEIRGFYTPVPEPATMTAVALGFGALALRRRRKAA
jgi:hypothetical protein